MSDTGKTYFEYRGVEGGVYAEVLSDTSAGITFGEVKEFPGLAEVGKSTESANEAHYYDNIPAIVVSSTGADTVTLNTAGVPLDVLADITGQYYDRETGMFVEEDRTPKYFALGYITEKTDGTKVLVWRLKGTFTVPEQTSDTKNAGTDANGQSMTYTGISTAYKFTKTGKPAKAISVDRSVYAVDIDSFFATVQTPDTVGADVDVEGVGLAPAAATLVAGSTLKLQPTIIPANASDKAVTYASSDDAVASVSSAGVVTAESAGTATITVTTHDGSFTDTCAVTVTSAP